MVCKQRTVVNYYSLSEETSDHTKPLLISAVHLYGMNTHEVLGILMVNIDKWDCLTYWRY